MTNPTEKRECKCKDFEYQGLRGRTDNLDCPVHHPVDSWKEEFDREWPELRTMYYLKQFISSQIQQAEERVVERIKKEYNKRYQKIAKEHGLKRKTPHTMFHDVLATLKEEKDL